jgi:hypothetical protein
MANLKTELEEAETFYGEQIEAMVVGKLEEYPYPDAQPDENVLLSREAGLAKVDREYDDGFGGADCHSLYAWTASRIFFVFEYDGATSLHWLPRHPTALEVHLNGNAQSWDEIAKIIAARKVATA